MTKQYDPQEMVDSLLTMAGLTEKPEHPAINSEQELRELDDRLSKDPKDYPGLIPNECDS